METKFKQHKRSLLLSFPRKIDSTPSAVFFFFQSSSLGKAHLHEVIHELEIRSLPLSSPNNCFPIIEPTLVGTGYTSLALHWAEIPQYLQHWWLLWWPRSVILSLYQPCDQCFPPFCSKIRSALSFPNKGRSLSNSLSKENSLLTNEKCRKASFNDVLIIVNNSAKKTFFSIFPQQFFSIKLKIIQCTVAQVLRLISWIYSFGVRYSWPDQLTPKELCWVRVHFGAAATWWLGSSAFHLVTRLFSDPLYCSYSWGDWILANSNALPPTHPLTASKLNWTHIRSRHDARIRFRGQNMLFM